LIHLNHKNSANNKFIRKFYISLIFYANIFFKNYCDEFKYILKTLYSILNQNYDNYEIIIIYDNSEQSNFYLIKSFIKVYKNLKIINNKKRKEYYILIQKVYFFL